MNPTLRRYMELAAEAETHRNTLSSQEKFMRLVRGEPIIHNLQRLTRGLEPVDKIRAGSLITFSYHAKTAKDLPYWDRYPLVLVTNINKDGWTGINFHYIHPRMRARLLYEANRLNKSIIEQDVVKLCYKRYLLKHTSSRPRLFPSSYFDIAIQLPFDNFQKAENAAVWLDTARKLK